VIDDIDDSLDILRPWIMGEAEPGIDLPPMTKDVWGQWWRFLKAKREFLALDAPKRTQVMPEEPNVTEANHPAAEKLARLVAWARETNAMNADGYQPALSPGMTEGST
jgi:hypothetical protein